MDVDFVAGEMENTMEVGPDPPDPLGIPDTVVGLKIELGRQLLLKNEFNFNLLCTQLTFSRK